MRILSIETSCDETALALLDAKGGLTKPSFKVVANALYSQVKIHEEFGGVFPMMAKREHAKNLVPLLQKILKKIPTKKAAVSEKMKNKLKMILEREPGLFDAFEKHIIDIKRPKIDLIAVTSGPGLEPALWVGINFAKALGLLWDIPVLPVNHMEGHIVSVLGKKPLHFPTLSLLISGGHTELVEAKKFGSYKILGKTRDDAVGEAFDKVARILGLPYPGGPQISKLAEKNRKSKTTETEKIILPRPMIHSHDFDFSFSGLKTAVLYLTQKLGALSETQKEAIAREFEDSVTDVLVSKTKDALKKVKAKTIIVAGGVSANTHIRKQMLSLKKEYKDIEILFPDKKLSTDNAVMIGMAGYLENLRKKVSKNKKIEARGNLSF